MNPLTRTRALVLDAWSALSHKQPLQDDARARLSGWTAKTWVGDEHRRRLAAYQILAAYDANVSREFLSTDDQRDIDDRREYGDAALIIDTVLSALLGDSQEIVVPGADDYDASLTEEPAEGEEAPTAEELAANAKAEQLAKRQEFLREWADDVHLALRLSDGERHDVRSGDGVYLLGWDADRQRVVPAVMDPGFYFPVLPDSLDGYDYPSKVHFAWEIPPEDFPDNKTRVRRITYEVRDLEPLEDDGPDGEPVEILPEGADWRTRRDGLRELVRIYPWSPEPSTKACYLTDATWVLDDLNDVEHVDAFTLDGAESFREGADGVQLVDHDLGIDFLPVVHIPNTPPGGDHFGQSSLARVLQLLDDLQSADTDAQASAATTGSPIISISGTRTTTSDPLTGQRGVEREVRPGALYELGENGRMDSIDTSGNLAATREYVRELRDRLAANSRIPGAVLGLVKPSEVPSGYALQLSFGPLDSMIRQMRLVRSVKYPLLLKMVQRLYQANGALEQGPTPRAEIALGSYLPSDRAGTLALVKDAYVAKLISLETAVAMLLDVGFPIDDVAEEIERIQERDYESANALADATGDNAAVRSFLGLPEQTEVTQAPLPPKDPADPIAGGSGVGEKSTSDSGVTTSD
jgi:hypothetical protein